MTSRSTLLASTQAALVLAALAGCGSDTDHASKSDPASDFVTDPMLVQSALTNPILDCQTTQGQCVLSAAGDFMAVQACNDQLASCLQTAADQAQAISKALTQCRDDGRTCLTSGGKPNDCRTQYETCSQSALGGVASASDAGVSLPTVPPPPKPNTPAKPATPSLPTAPALDGGLSLPVNGGGLQLPGSNGGLQLPTLPTQPALPTLPTQPTVPGLQLDSGLLNNLPPHEKCLVSLRLCVAADPTMANKCGDDARACLMVP